MKRSAPWFVALLAVGFAAAAQAGIFSPADRAAVYDRAARYFEDAILLKPRATGAETNLEFALAPLLLQELTETNSSAWPTVVWFEPGQTVIRGTAHQQMSFWWEANPRGTDNAVGRKKRGVRVTLNAQGAPVIWETLNDHSGGRVIFVAQSLEAAARARHGGVLPGRRFAVESASTATPEAVVARVIENNPTVMGPMVQLNTRGELTTLICRCMPAQTRAVSGNSYYDLRPLPKGPPAAAAELETELRLPPEF